MKILMVVHSFVPESFSGVEVHVHNLARILGERHTVHVFCPTGGRPGTDFFVTRDLYRGVSVLRVQNGRSEGNLEDRELVPGMRRAFAEILDELEPDLVHFHHMLRLSADLLDEVQARGIAAVTTLHDFWYLCARIQLYRPHKGRCSGPTPFKCADCFPREDELIRSMGRLEFLSDKGVRLWKSVFSQIEWPEPMLLYERRIDRMRDLLNRMDFHIANSKCLSKHYVRFGTPRDKIRVGRIGLDLPRLQACAHPPSAEVRFSYIGSIVKHKGIDLLLKAFRKVPEASLKIWGDYQANAAVSLYYAGLSPPNNVRFMGGFENQQIDRVLRETDVLLVPSIWEEAYGLTVDEAKAAGIPVIASRIGGIPEHLRDGKEGYLFNPDSPRELETMIRRLAGRPDRVKALSPSGDDLIDLFENAEDVESVYRMVLRKRAAQIQG